MLWWWRRPIRVKRWSRPTHRPRTHAVWADLIGSDAPLVRAAELVALERVLHESTVILERGVRVPPFVVAHRREVHYA